MLVKCICTNCAGHLAFDEENAGEKIDCPHCGFETTLTLPGSESKTEPVPYWRRREVRRQAVWVALSLLLVGAVAFALYRWVLPPLKDWLNTESLVLAIAVLLGICLLVSLVLVWLAFPFVLVVQLRKLTDVLAEIEANVRPGLEEEPEEPEEPEDLDTIPEPAPTKARVVTGAESAASPKV